MTSPNTGLRRTALVVLAVGAALGASACGAGQHTQTGSQVAAVDGGSAAAGDLHVNDVQVAVPASGEGEAKVGFAVSYTGAGLGEPITLRGMEVDGTPVQIESDWPLGRGCTLIAALDENAPERPGGDAVCTRTTTATLPSSEGLFPGVSVPATVTFSDGTRMALHAGVVAEPTVAGEYTRPSEPASAEEH